MKRMLEELTLLYGADAEAILQAIRRRFGEGYEARPTVGADQTFAVLITYGNTLQRPNEKPLRTLKRFLDEYVGNALTAVHLLPIYPYSSDDGFSVIDYRSVNEEWGDWEDVRAIGKRYALMLDAVINHASRRGEWFARYLRCEEPYERFFITRDPEVDYSCVIRPRSSPLFTRVQTAKGPRWVWTTFSDDQMDLNFRSPELLLEILDVLLGYARNGARLLRLDAIGFAWKNSGTTCMNLPQTHALVRLFRAFLDRYAPGTTLATETNVPSDENLAYLGDGTNEAGMVYQFPLPPLTLHAFLTQNAAYLTQWAMKLPQPGENATFFNFLASHDGIGLRPAEGILPPEEIERMTAMTEARGGLVSRRDAGHGRRTVYELNINYMDALAPPEADDRDRTRRFLAAHTLLLSLAGVPGVYIHSLLGSHNARQEALDSGINRRINRACLNADAVEGELGEPSLRRNVFEEIRRRLKLRGMQAAFHPKAGQRVLDLDKRVFCVLRTAQHQQIAAAINVSDEAVQLPLRGYELLQGRYTGGNLLLEAHQAAWVVLEDGV